MRQETTDRSFSKAYNLRVLTSRTYLLNRIQSSSPDNAYGTPNCRCRRQCLSCHHNPGAAREKKRASQRLILVVTVIYFVRVSFILVCLTCSELTTACSLHPSPNRFLSLTPSQLLTPLPHPGRAFDILRIRYIWGLYPSIPQFVYFDVFK